MTARRRPARRGTGPGPLGFCRAKGRAPSCAARKTRRPPRRLRGRTPPRRVQDAVVRSTNRGPSPASAASSSVSRNDMGSAQCRSSRTSTVGPLPTSRATTAPTAAKVARWSPSGLSRARRPQFRAGAQAHHVGQEGNVVDLAPENRPSWPAPGRGGPLPRPPRGRPRPRRTGVAGRDHKASRPRRRQPGLPATAVTGRCRRPPRP